MREIIIRNGVYGFRDEKGRVKPVSRGGRISVSDSEAARLAALGVALYTDVRAGLGQAAPVREDSISRKADADETEIAKLERMSKADLEQMARDMGVDISSAKNNRERAVLLSSVELQDSGEEPPDLEAEGIVT